jgi:predicted regulator of Ras-like GTPase activity (Roadblock/LC7/MglB family)
VDAAQALAELREISSQIDEAAIVGGDGQVIGSTHGDANRLAAAAASLLDQAAKARPGADPIQVEASVERGSVFVLREHERTIVATTGPQPTTGLVFYDLKSCLRRLDPPKPKRRRSPRKEAGADAS